MGDRLLEGKALYIDIRETKPLLAMWSAVPAVLVAEALGVEASLAFDLVVVAGTLFSIGPLPRRYCGP